MQGLGDDTAIGNVGLYREREGERATCTPTCYSADTAFCRYGDRRPLFAVELPEAFHTAIRNRSWTGLTRSYSGEGWTLDTEVRATLPGPLFRTTEPSLHLRWLPGNDARLAWWKDARAADAHLDLPCEGARIVFVRCAAADALIVANRPLRGIRTVASRHWKLDFGHGGGAALIVPMAKATDPEPLFAHANWWEALAKAPPLRCEEAFEDRGSSIAITQRFPGADVAPLPPLLSLWGQRGNLLALPDATVLCPTAFGPYAVVRGDAWHATIAAHWMDDAGTPVVPAPPEGLANPPEELAYAGDWTWDENSVMDRLLSLRTWAPLIGALPEPSRPAVLSRLRVPTPEEFRAKVHRVREPVRGVTWARDYDLWRERGDATYDVDWYNGLMLSGLERATRCADRAIANDARTLAAACRPERDLFVRYFTLYHDWLFSSAMTDPRGNLWLPDCVRNGMEGMLAESRLRAAEGDPAGASQMRYLVAKTGSALLAATRWPHWLREHAPTLLHQFQPGDNPFLAAPHDDRLFGTNAVFLPVTLFPSTAAVRNPYQLAGHFPEYAALFREHGPVNELRELVAIWEREFPERYTDWRRYYLGDDFHKRFVSDKDQEAREQAAVFYHLAPEVCFRLWVLREDPLSIASRYATPLNLAEQLLLAAVPPQRSANPDRHPPSHAP